MAVYKFLDVFFIVFHASLVVFNVTGWLFRKTRFLNLLTQTMTAFSWFFLGIWYGWGYCFWTDWHFKIRAILGYEDVSSSYIHFLILQITGLNLPEKPVMVLTMAIFLMAFTISIFLNARDYLKRKKK